MGRDWDYIFYCRQDTEPRTLIDALFDCAAELGYRSTAEREGESGFAWVTTTESEYRCESLEETKEVLMQAGGCTSVLKDDYVSASFQIDARRILVSSGTSLVEWHDNALESDLQALFLRLLNSLVPLYAFSADEWSFEFRLAALGDFEKGQAQLEAAIAVRKPPPILWWLNYFPREHYMQVEERLSDLDGLRLRDLRHGVVLQLSDRAWDVKTAILGADGAYHLTNE